MTSGAEARGMVERPDHVLVPLDGGEYAARAIPTARALARRLDARFRTISVARTDDHVGPMRAALETLGIETAHDPMSVVVGRDPADAIVHRAAELGRSTVCLATRGRGRLTGALLGSVARSVLQRADGPVVALGPLADNPGRIPPPRSWPEPLSVPRIVACVDGTPDAEQIVPLAARWAGWLGMSLSLLTIVVDSLGTGTHKHDASRFGPDGDPECYLDGLVEQCRVSTALVDAEVFTDPVGLISGIRTYLDRRPAGLLALATRARMGGDRIRGGATAAAIVHASVAPCLVVHISDGSGAGRVDTAV